MIIGWKWCVSLLTACGQHAVSEPQSYHTEGLSFWSLPDWCFVCCCYCCYFLCLLCFQPISFSKAFDILTVIILTCIRRVQRCNSDDQSYSPVASLSFSTWKTRENYLPAERFWRYNINLYYMVTLKVFCFLFVVCLFFLSLPLAHTYID